jgi:hypothetical protein
MLYNIYEKTVTPSKQSKLVFVVRVDVSNSAKAREIAKTAGLTKFEVWPACSSAALDRVPASLVRA